jgi:hypothetical protein
MRELVFSSFPGVSGYLRLKWVFIRGRYNESLFVALRSVVLCCEEICCDELAYLSKD